MTRTSAVSAIATLLSICGTSQALEAEDCNALMETSIGAMTVEAAELVEATERLPQHCRLVVLVPEFVRFELRLPEPWNGKFLMVGNGGYLGVFFDQSYGLTRGYATASTDTGHQGPDPRFALNNPQGEIDFAWRAVHETAVGAKQFIEQHYGQEPDYAYFRGCSTGGRQALMEAQRFPEDFDGWSVGAPIYDYTYKQIYNAAWVARALFENDRAGYLARENLRTLGTAVTASCDAIDGLEDGLIDDPRQCEFDPRSELRQCSGGDEADCFTAAQIDAIEKIYAGPGEDVYPGAAPSGEWMDVPEGNLGGGWDTFFTGTMGSPHSSDASARTDSDPYGGDQFVPVQLRNGSSFFQYFAFDPDRPEFDIFTDLDFDAVPDVSAIADLMNATDTDLADVREAGKKIVMWHGWADVGLNPLRTIEYYEGVESRMGEEDTRDFFRLFMVPGMYHCQGGPGPDIFDDLTALENWVESGDAPNSMTAYKTGEANGFAPDRGPGAVNEQDAGVVRSRLLCPYPEVARRTGSGSIDSAASFACVAE